MALRRFLPALLLVLATLTTGLTATAPAASAVVPAPTVKYVEIRGDATPTLQLSWDHVGTDLGSYEIWYRPSGTSEWLWSSTASVGESYRSWVPYVPGQSTYTRDFRATGLTAGNSYDVTVVAVSTSGEGSGREASAVSVRVNPPLGALTTTATPTGELTVSWPAYTATPFHQFDIYLSRGQVEKPSWSTFKPSATSTSHTFTGLVPGAPYTVGVRVTQAEDQVDGRPVRWVRSFMRSAVQRIPSDDLFYAAAPSAFVRTSDDQPVTLNGANIRRGTYKVQGVWQTDPYVTGEIDGMAAPGAPAFNAIRVALDWPYFQKKVGSSIVIDEDAFDQLDLVIDKAIQHGIYVILDPIHSANLTANGGRCTEDPVMLGAHRDIPAWLWSAIGEVPGTTCETTTAWNDKMDDALARQETADYLRYILARYDGTDTDPQRQARGKQVIAVDLVNEPLTDGATSSSMTQKMITDVYTAWLAPSGPKSLRAVDPGKPLIVEQQSGSGSLVGVDLTPVAKPNVILSFHDYFGRALETDPVHGIGYSPTGFSTRKERTDDELPGGGPYNTNTLDSAARMAQRKEHLRLTLDRATAAGLPLLIGEYGIMNPCGGGTLAYVTQYAKDSYAVYQELGLSRLVWTNGNWDSMAIWWRGSTACGTTPTKTYFPYAKDLTGGAVRP